MTLTSPSGFADRVRSAVFWRWGSQVLSQLITWTTTILVVRLLEPSDYGLFAMTQAVLAALNFLNGYGFATSLIQADKVDERRIGQVFGLLIISNMTIAGAQFLMAPLAADYYNQPMVADLLRVQALLYLTTPFIALPSSLLARGLKFKGQALVQLLCAVVGATVALILAWNGYGVWALVWAPIAMFTVRGIGLTIAAGGLVRPVFDFKGARDIIGFGAAMTTCQLFWIVQSEADIVIGGRFLETHQLGLYAEAMFLSMIFTGRFLPALNDVAYPAYSELKNSGKPIGPAFLSSIRLIMLIATPFYIGASLVAGPLVTTFFGPKWLEMIPVVASLTLVMPAMALQLSCSPATNATGRPTVYVFSSISGAIIFSTAYFIGVTYGLEGMVAAWYVAAPLLLAITLAATLPTIGVSPFDLVKALLPAATGCAIMAVPVLFLERVTDGLLAPLQLALLSATGAATYFAVLRVLWPDLVRETWFMLRRPRESLQAPVGRTTTTPGDDGA